MEEVVNLVTSLITNLGFPIAVCCYLFWSNNKERENAREEREQEREAHAEEMRAMRNAVEDRSFLTHGKRVPMFPSLLFSIKILMKRPTFLIKEVNNND